MVLDTNEYTPDIPAFSIAITYGVVVSRCTGYIRELTNGDDAAVPSFKFSLESFEGTNKPMTKVPRI